MKVLLTVFLSFIGTALFAQNDAEMLMTVQQQAQIMSDAFHKADYEQFMDGTHPRVIEQMGGREKLKALISGGLGAEVQFIKTDITKQRSC